MKKQLLLIAAVALSISACNEDSLPTGAGRDLLNNPAHTPALGNSKYGMAFADDAVVDSDSIIDPVPAVEAHRDSTAGDVHIKDLHNRSQYKPAGYEHIARGNPNATKYKPEGWEHRGPTTWPRVDHSKYIPPKYRHVASGANETRYRKP